MDPSTDAQWLSTPVALALMAVAILMVAFFSASEAALLTAGRVRMRNRADKGDAGAATVLRVVSQHDRLFATILASENLCIIAASALGTALAIRLVGGSGVIYATAVMSVAIIIFGEITPKTFAASHADVIAPLVAWPIEWVMRILSPFVWVLGGLPRWLLRQAPVEPGRGAGLTGDELRTLVGLSRAGGGITAAESEMLRRVLELRRVTARDLMTPRTQLAAVHLRSPVWRIVAAAKSRPYSRLVVYGKDFDELVGALRVRDMVGLDPSAKGSTLRGLVRPLPTVPASMRATEILHALQAARSPMAVVTDEYGGTAGIVTATDVLDEIGGRIAEERGEPSDAIVSLEGTWTIPGNTPLGRVNEDLGVRLPDDKFRTVAGWLLHRLGRIAAGGEGLTEQGIEFTIAEVSGRRIVAIRARRVAESRDTKTIR